ncbi:hypothetical protein BGX24_008898 [Mortierella sp. AD032]|nr:hypothetical protein BGX24_008898 [Mortierella sp. AD032]
MSWKPFAIITGAIAAPVAVPLVVGAMGFGAGGIVAGSWAASIMASYGGAVASGSVCAVLQSVGVVGLSTSGTILAAVAGGTATKVMTDRIKDDNESSDEEEEDDEGEGEGEAEGKRENEGKGKKEGKGRKEGKGGDEAKEGTDAQVNYTANPPDTDDNQAKEITDYYCQQAKENAASDVKK